MAGTERGGGGIFAPAEDGTETSGTCGYDPQMTGIITGLQIARNAIQDPKQRAKAGGGLGWETGRDVVERLLRLAETGKLWQEVQR